MNYSFLIIIFVITFKCQGSAQYDKLPQFPNACSKPNVTCFCFRDPNADECELIENVPFENPTSIKCLRYFETNESQRPETHNGKICLNLSNKEDSVDKISVNKLFFTDCPPPKISYKHIMDYLRISEAKILKIRAKKSNHFNQADIFLQLNETSVLDLSNMNPSFINDVLLKIPNITEFMLNNNNLNLVEGTIKSATKLKSLNLRRNHLESLKLEVFENMLNLNFLFFSENKLVKLEKGIFDNTPNLETLIIDNNYLHVLTEDVFADLKKLTVISLSNNRFFSLPDRLFSNNVRLRHVRINRTKTLRNIPSRFLANMPNLQNVDFSGCNIHIIKKDSFWGSRGIKYIRLDDNSLSSIPDDLFKDGQELIEINLTKNNIESLPNKLFYNTKKLEKLLLAKNQLKNIQMEVFSNLISVTTLDLSSNKISSIHKNAFSKMKNLTYLHLQNNLIKSPQEIPLNTLPFLTTYKLKILDLSGNSITNMPIRKNITTNEFYKNLEVLNLAHNNFSELQIKRLQEWPMLIGKNLKVDLSYNNISRMNFEFDPNYDISSKQVLSLNLEGNPFNCDCHSYSSIMHLQERNSSKNIMKNIQINSDDKLVCTTPQELKNKSLIKVSSSELKCAIENTKFFGKECERFEVPHHNSTIEINCSNKSIHYISYIPDNIDAEYHTYNHRNIKLNLSQNLITNLFIGSYERLKIATELDLSFNNISEINISKLSPNITVLKLHNNNLRNLNAESVDFLNRSSTLKEITLHGNPWKCDCETKHLIYYIQTHPEKFLTEENATCPDGTALYKIQQDKLCSELFWFPIIISGLIVSIITGTTFALFYHYQLEIKVWCYTNKIFLSYITEEERDHNKEYDAFISYSDKDEEFVRKTLIPGLEGGEPKFKLCWRIRDWFVGEPNLSCIAESVFKSRRTIIVLSDNFLEYLWGMTEFRTAHIQALEDGSARVIVILYSDTVKLKHLDPELKAYISINTYVKWNDPLFWGKLRYYLPHPPKKPSSVKLTSAPLTSV